MKIDLSDKVALVTGSTAGIGKAIATGLARAGAAVVVNGRSAERVEAAVAAIAGAAGPGATVSGVAADVGTAAGCAALIDAVPEVDVLVSNAAAFGITPVFEIPDEDWLRLFEVNVLAGVRLARHYVPRMVDAGSGRVIFIASESALQIPSDMVHYGMTKTAQLSVARGMAEAIPGTGVTINSVLPGPTMTEALSEMLAPTAEEAGCSIEEAGRRFLADVRPTSLLGRFAHPEEVANMVVYTASPQAAATNGAALRVEGGIVRGLG